MSTPSVFIEGVALGLGLIVAIGAQNAFVLRQGLRREHVGAVVLFCAAADVLLSSAGVLGLGQLIGERPGLARAMAAAGALFLFGYGLRALWRARQPGALAPAATTDVATRSAVLAQAAAFTLLNPHVYLDTVLLVGSVGAQHTEGGQRALFIAGVSAASALWFSLLGYGSRRLSPWFARPRAWQALDLLVGATMLALAALLAARFVA